MIAELPAQRVAQARAMSDFKYSPQPHFPSVTDGHALSYTCPPFNFWHISSPDRPGIPEGYSQRWVGSPYTA